MADITSCIEYSKETKASIKKKESSHFNHTNWGDDDLLEVRKEIRKFYRTKQKGICAFCKQTVSLISASNCHIEHIVPKSLHLEYIFTPKNLCVICADCNQIKRDQETLNEIPQTMNKSDSRKKYPKSGNGFYIVHPHFDNYDDHILIINGYYIDKSSKKGNFTIGACNLNRKLAEFGWEPEFVNDSVIIDEMNSFIDETDSLKRTNHLNNIRNQLFDV